MASGDARPIPRKNVAYRVTFPIFDADGDLVSGATGLDSEISKDGGTFADCTSEATEIASSSGMYFLDLTSTEMNADTVAIIVKTTSVGAKTTPIVMYPEEAGDIRVDAVQWNGTAVASPHTAGYPVVTIKDGTGTGEVDTSSGAVPVYDLTTAALGDIWTTAITEAYAADGAAATPAQLLYMILSALAEFSISGTTITCKKIDGSTTSMTFTLNDATNPTSRTRAT